MVEDYADHLHPLSSLCHHLSITEHQFNSFLTIIMIMMILLDISLHSYPEFMVQYCRKKFISVSCERIFSSFHPNRDAGTNVSSQMLVNSIYEISIFSLFFPRCLVCW